MHFVDRGHLDGILPHRPVDGVQNAAITCSVDESRKVSCPIKRGAVTFHHSKTPHMTPANSSTRWRKAVVETTCKRSAAAKAIIYPWKIRVRISAPANGPAPVLQFQRAEQNRRFWSRSVVLRHQSPPMRPFPAATDQEVLMIAYAGSHVPFTPRIAFFRGSNLQLTLLTHDCHSSRRSGSIQVRTRLRASAPLHPRAALPPGAPLHKEDIALELGVSRAPVSEAISRLADEGLVEVFPRHGSFVAPIRAAEVRKPLHPHCA